MPSSVCVCVCVCVGGWVQRSERDDGTFLDEKLVLDIFFNGVAIKVRAFARRRKERPFVRHVMEPCVPTCVCVCVCVCVFGYVCVRQRETEAAGEGGRRSKKVARRSAGER